MGKPKLVVYLDVVSPFAYLSFYITKHSLIFKNCDVSYIPIFLGAIMHAAGNRTPIEIKNKNEYIRRERATFAKAFNVPMADEFPSPFPPLTLHVMRTICALVETHPNKVDDYFAALYHKFWVERVQITTPDIFPAILASIIGEDEAKKVVELSKGPDAKNKLRANTDEAFKSGAFGLPWMVATNTKGETQGFWGINHLGFVADFLQLDRSIDPGFRPML